MDKVAQIANIIADMNKCHEGNESFAKVAEKIVESETFRNASDKDLEKILIDLMHSVYSSTKGICVRTYSSNRWSQTELIKASLYAVAPPRIDFSIK